jgi:uncharacterized protein
MDTRILQYLIGEFANLKNFQIENTILLLEEGCTIPFIARYRKEKTGELDEVQIQAIRDRHQYLTELEDRKTTIIDTIEKAGKMTEDLRSKIVACMKKQELEDLYLPYRPKRRTRGQMAREKGLEPLAYFIRDYTAPEADLSAICEPYLFESKGVVTIQDALEGVRDILAEDVSEVADYRKFIRRIYAEEGTIRSAVKKEYEGQPSKFEMYYDHKEPLKSVPSHRLLAMRRGEKEKVLSLEIFGPDERILGILHKFWVRHPESFFAPLLEEALSDGYNRLILPSICLELLLETKTRADDEAILVFEKNLRHLLLLPPGGQRAVLGLDPGFRTGCKCAVVDRTGQFRTETTIFPIEPYHKVAESETALLPLIKEHGIEVVAIGNGTASREVFAFVKEMLQKYELEKDVRIYVVNEAGASVYSASEKAREEFPDLDVTIRGAVSIARRFQDPLAELVKIDPKSIGVGQYQHDVNQRKLKHKLTEVVQFVVNQVGVELNSASASLLEYVSGINSSLAKAIVERRFQHGPFQNRQELREIPRFGEKTFEQAAGFLRIRDGEYPLDASAVHPESYPVVEQMATDLGVSVRDLVGNVELVPQIDLEKYRSDGIGLPTLRDIAEELKKPGRDPREELTSFEFDTELKEISDLREGMVLAGIVTNVTDFGAFVDVGVHQDGLVHVSRMGKKVRAPYECCGVGQKVSVRVVAVDLERKRISLALVRD